MGWKEGWVVKPITWSNTWKGYCCRCEKQYGFSYSETRCRSGDCNHVFCGQCTAMDDGLERPYAKNSSPA